MDEFYVVEAFKELRKHIDYPSDAVLLAHLKAIEDRLTKLEVAVGAEQRIARLEAIHGLNAS